MHSSGSSEGKVGGAVEGSREQPAVTEGLHRSAVLRGIEVPPEQRRLVSDSVEIRSRICRDWAKLLSKSNESVRNEPIVVSSFPMRADTRRTRRLLTGMVTVEIDSTNSHSDSVQNVYLEP